MSRKIAFVVNGEIKNSAHLKKRLKSFDVIIAVDGGLSHLDAIGVTPDILIGDLDSYSIGKEQRKALRKKIRVIEEYPVDKDETDLELALLHLKPNDTGVIFGGFGIFPDHTYMHYVLLSRYKGKLFLETEVIENKMVTQVVCIEKSLEIRGKKGSRVSLFPFSGSVKGVSTSGLKWELNQAEFSKTKVGVSNILVQARARVSVESGDLLAFFGKSEEELENDEYKHEKQKKRE